MQNFVVIGDGSKIKFWWDNWLEDLGPLIIVEPSFRVNNNEVTISEVAPDGQWNRSFFSNYLPP